MKHKRAFRVYRGAAYAAWLAVLNACGGSETGPVLGEESAALRSQSATSESAGPDVSDVVEDDFAVVIHELRTRAGARVRFLEGDPGDLAVDVLAPEDAAALPEFEVLREGHIDELEFFRQITDGAEPPVALIEAVRRAADAASAGEWADDEPEYGAQGGGATSIGQESAGIGTFGGLPAWLEFCNGNWDFAYCWMNVTGNPWCKHKCNAMEGRVKAIGGPVQIRMRYKKLGAWKTYLWVTVPKGATYYIQHYNWHIKRWRHFQVLNNDAHYVHHFACVGFD